MFEIDGSQKSGSGTILRLSIALSAIKQQPLHITNIRQSRPQPGLKRQHLEAVLTAAKLCNAKVEGAKLASKELWFTPNPIEGGNIEAEIETAGSIPMLLMAALPICVFAKNPVKLHVTRAEPIPPMPQQSITSVLFCCQPCAKWALKRKSAFKSTAIIPKAWGKQQ
jgi:RNA 3'-terminal phosphate cyclase (ATP)